MLSILVTLLFAAGGPVDDLKSLEGHWALTSQQFRGEAVNAEKIKNYQITIEDDIESSYAGQAKLFTSKIRLDPTANPKRIDLTRQRDNQTVPGIYKVEGDTLTLCTASGGGRPNDFSTAPGSLNQLRVYKRQKPLK